jgi:hypothetical protein
MKERRNAANLLCSEGVVKKKEDDKKWVAVHRIAKCPNRISKKKSQWILSSLCEPYIIGSLRMFLRILSFCRVGLLHLVQIVFFGLMNVFFIIKNIFQFKKRKASQYLNKHTLPSSAEKISDPNSSVEMGLE